jgi:hypothetical protein
MYEGEDGQEQECSNITKNINKLDFRKFDMFIFNVRWFKDVIGKVSQCSINVQASGYMTID